MNCIHSSRNSSSCGSLKHHTSMFKLDKSFGEGQTIVLHLETDQRETATALALCPADKGMDYKVQFDTIFFASEGNVGEYSSKLLKPRFTPAKSDHPVLTQIFSSPVYSNPAGPSLADVLSEGIEYPDYPKDYYPGENDNDYPPKNDPERDSYPQIQMVVAA